MATKKEIEELQELFNQREIYSKRLDLMKQGAEGLLESGDACIITFQYKKAETGEGVGFYTTFENKDAISVLTSMMAIVKTNEDLVNLQIENGLKK